jgi:DNA-binding MarR family transcriptional regulator
LSEQPLIRVDAAIEQEWPGASASATECVLNLYVLATLIERGSHAWLRSQGVPSLAAFNVMTVLAGADEPLQPSTISARLMVTRGTLTGILDSLEKADLIDRRPHGDDGRMRVVTLTDAGRQKADELRPRIHRAERRLMNRLTADEQTALVGMLARLQGGAADLEF